MFAAAVLSIPMENWSAQSIMEYMEVFKNEHGEYLLSMIAIRSQPQYEFSSGRMLGAWRRSLCT